MNVKVFPPHYPNLTNTVYDAHSLWFCHSIGAMLENVQSIRDSKGVKFDV